MSRMNTSSSDGSPRVQRCPPSAFLAVAMAWSRARSSRPETCSSAPNGATGRLRHLYVRPAWRRQGVGKALVEEVLGSARSSFSRVRLRTDDAAAGAFYAALGFAASTEPNATHVYVFRR